jgi:hypothetical protein
LAVVVHTTTVQETVSQAESSLDKQFERTSQLLAEARDIVRNNNLHQRITVTVDSVIAAILATPGSSQLLDFAVTATLVTLAFFRQLDAVIAGKVTAQVDQYIDRAATREVEARFTQQLEDVFKSFCDAVLTQQKEVKESLQAAQTTL